MVKNLVEAPINLKLIVIKNPVQIAPVTVRVVVRAATVEANHPALAAAAAVKKAVGMEPLPCQKLLRVHPEVQHCV